MTMLEEPNGNRKRVELQETSAQMPAIPLFESLPDFEPWGYVAEAYLGGNSYAGRATYRVRRVKDDTICILKLVRFHKSNWDTIRQIAEREYQTLAALDHRCIPKALELLQPGQEDWIGVVQSFVEGVPLSEFTVRTIDTVDDMMSSDESFHRRVLSYSSVMSVALKIVQILSYLQDLKLFHGDIKPENVLIDASLTPHLIDFGASLHVRSEEELSHSTMLGYTPGFIDPKVLCTGAAPTDRSDLYSLGCTILCKLLNLSTAEFSRKFGLLFSEASFDSFVRPAQVAEGQWAWVLSLLKFGDESVQPSDAREAFARYQQSILTSSSVVVANGTEEAEIEQAFKPDPVLRLIGKVYAPLLAIVALFSIVYVHSDELAFYSDSNAKSPVGQVIDAVQSTSDEGRFRILKDQQGMLRKYESLEVVSLEFSDEAYDLLKSDYVREQDEYPNKGFGNYLSQAAEEYEFFLTQIDGVEKVSVGKGGVTVHRQSSSVRSWELIALDVEARLLELAREPLVAEPFLGADVVRCRSLCDYNTSLEAQSSFAIFYEGEERSLAELGIDEYSLWLALHNLSATGPVTIDVDRGYIDIRQHDNFKEPWPVLKSKVETIVAEFIDRAEQKRK